MNTSSLCRAAGAIGLLLGLAALVGWHFDIAVLRSVIPGRSTMNPTTAVALILLGSALWLARAAEATPRTRTLARLAAGSVALLSLTTLLGYALGRDLGIHQLLLIDRWAASDAGSVTRVAAPTALNLLLISSAALLMDVRTRIGRPLAHACALAAAAVGLVALTGHAFGASFQSGLPVLRPMALNTAMAMTVLCAGLIAALPDYGLAALLRRPTPGGALARRLLPAILLIPMALFWIRLQGEQAGWYDREGGRAILVAALVAVLGALTWRAAVLLDRADAERRRAETALRASEERYRLLFELNPEPVWVFDMDTLRFLAVNPAAVTRYGYTVDEFRSMTIRDIRPPEDVPRLLERVAHLGEQSGARPDKPWRHRAKEGALLEVEITSHMLTFEGKRAQLVLAHDVTERRRAEAALQASEEQFRSLAVTANDAIISADASGNITYFNPAAERAFGYTAGEVAGKSLTVLMPERFHELHRRGLDRYLSTGVAHVIGRTVELAGRKQDGTEFPIELSLASWRREHETAFTAVIRDITARKQADDDLKRYAAQLEAANAELDAFAYSVSHDLRAPLRSIDGFSLALLEDSGDSLDATGRDHLRRVRAAAQRMALLIDDLLGLSRVTRATLQREPVDLSAMAGAVAAELEHREPGRCVEFAIAPGLAAEGDPRLLRVVLENLIRNAWKYTGRNARARIEFAATEADGSRAYYVRDDGAGFDMTYADKLFGAFQRLHSSDEFEGTGIGLATVQRIVHRHGGRVWAEGAVGRGATFYFTL